METDKPTREQVAAIIAETEWNGGADQHNQWDNLSQEERDELTADVLATMPVEGSDEGAL